MLNGHGAPSPLLARNVAAVAQLEAAERAAAERRPTKGVLAMTLDRPRTSRTAATGRSRPRRLTPPSGSPARVPAGARRSSSYSSASARHGPGPGRGRRTRAKRRPDMPTLAGGRGLHVERTVTCSGRRTRSTARGGISSPSPACSRAISSPSRRRGRADAMGRGAAPAAPGELGGRAHGRRAGPAHRVALRAGRERATSRARSGSSRRRASAARRSR